MATISGNLIFDRDRSATISNGDIGIGNIPVVLQDVATTLRLTVLTNTDGAYSFINVPNGNYRIVEAFGISGGVPTPGDFTTAVAGSVPEGMNPPITVIINPPTGSTNLDSVTPNTLLVTVSNTDLTDQDFFNGPVIYTPIQEILDPSAIISGDNLIHAANNGTFGSCLQGTSANTGSITEPYPGVTPDFIYVLPNPDIVTPSNGEYTVQNIMNNSKNIEIDAWWRIADHTMGNETGRMMVVNGDTAGTVFFKDVVKVQPNTSYLFSLWILNVFRANGYANPSLGIRVLAQDGSILYNETLETLIPINMNAPEWRQIGSVINSQNNTTLTVEFLSEGPNVTGNDYAIDNISFNEIQIPTFIPVKTVDHKKVNVKDTVRYTVSLTNPFTSTLTDVFFQDIVPNSFSFVPGSTIINGKTELTANPNIGFSLPDISSGKTVTVTFSAVVNAIPTPNPVPSSAKIRYFYTPVKGGIANEFNTTSNEVLVEVNEAMEADISIIKTANSSSVSAGEVLIYTLLVSNAGPSTAENTNLTDILPSELNNAEISIDEGRTWTPFNGTFFIGNLAPNASSRILIRATVSASASKSLTNTAVVKSSTSDPNLSNNTSTINTTIRTGADLSIEKVAEPNPVIRCQRLTYKLTVTNNGPEMANQVTICDNLPLQLCRPIYSTNNGQTWQAWTGSYTIGSLRANTSMTILISGIVSSCARCAISNTAMVSSFTPDPNFSNNISCVTVCISQC